MPAEIPSGNCHAPRRPRSAGRFRESGQQTPWASLELPRKATIVKSREHLDLTEELLLDQVHGPVEHQEEEGDVEVDHAPSAHLDQRRDRDSAALCESGQAPGQHPMGCVAVSLLVSDPDHLARIDILRRRTRTHRRRRCSSRSMYRSTVIRSKSVSGRLRSRFRSRRRWISASSRAIGSLPIGSSSASQSTTSSSSKVVAVLFLGRVEQVLGLHSEQERRVEEGAARDPQIESLLVLELGEKPIRHLDDVDPPGVDLAPLGHADQEGNRFLNHRYARP